MSDRESVDDDIRALYREPVQGFIAARNSLVKALVEAGRSEEAARVKALRKPAVPAWALDQLADRDPDGIRSLFDAGAEVKAAQQAALSSDRHADRLREATASRRRAVDRLSAIAADVLVQAGHGAASHTADIRATLEAASVDPDAAQRLRAGTFDRPITEVAGFGEIFGLRSVPDDEGSDSGSVEVETTEQPVSKADKRVLRRDRDAAARKALQARESADRLAGQVGTTQSRLEELLERHAVAEARALEAELEAKRAEDVFREGGVG
jgi:hypothetical protein